MDLATLKDDLNRLECDFEDLRVLGMELDERFWSECEKTRLKLISLDKKGGYLSSQWNELMQRFKAPPQMMVETVNRYEDVVQFHDDDVAEDVSPNIDLDDTQLFIHNTQLQEAQDSHLETLHASVKTQRHIANTINTHLNEETIILGDLESQIDRTHERVNHARGRMAAYQRQSRNSTWLWREWLVILALLVLLMLLLRL